MQTRPGRELGVKGEVPGRSCPAGEEGEEEEEEDLGAGRREARTHGAVPASWRAARPARLLKSNR